MSWIPGRRILVLVGVVILLIAAVPYVLRYYRYFSTHVSTDDAYVDGNIDLISSRVPGTVSRLYVQDNWIVNAGDLLLELDPRDFQARVDRDQAQLERAHQIVDQLFSQLQVADAGVKLADAQLLQARLDFQRAQALHTSRVVSEDYYDHAYTALKQAEANRQLTQQEVERSKAALGGSLDDHARYARPIVEQAQADLNAALLDLSYTRITAPVNGIVTRKAVQLGHRVQPGQPLMSLVPVDSLYITANFKETQLTDVRVGQKVDVEADIYPGYVYHGHIDSISFGTGSAFSLLPPENATGNWVKVVQRVPVKIVLDQKEPADKQLRLGLSVDVAIDISDTSGPLLSSTLQHRRAKDGNAPGPLPPPNGPNLQH
ncbi:MAG TPA: HlyD family secretion protein [Candidatus Binataceae bacterium]|nr:HlyD family secretion protein [Candidatus Binataceae bacterium]